MSHPVLIVLTILIFSWLLQPIAAISETFLENLSSPSAPEISLLESVPDSGNTQSLPKSVVSFVDFSEFVGNESDTLQTGNWSGVHGGTSPDVGVDSWHRVVIPPYQSDATSRKLYLDPSIKEAWASYSMQLGANWTPTDSVKLPGFSGHHNEGWRGAAGGNGGGWGGLCKSWSARSIIATPSTESWGGKLVQYVYHADSDKYEKDANASNHPCLDSSNNPVLKNKRQFGENISTTGYIKDNEWHTLTHHVRLNDVGEYNGIVELYLDGELVSKATGLNFTNEDEYHNISFWLQVYHGGSADTSGTEHDVFFHNFRWNAGSENHTL